jgi:hypothetical protein
MSGAFCAHALPYLIHTHVTLCQGVPTWTMSRMRAMLDWLATVVHRTSRLPL